MFNEEELNREIKELIKYVKSKTALNQLCHKSIMRIIDDFYNEESEKHGIVK